MLVAQSCPIFCDPMDCSLPGSSVHGILQARILEWVAIFSPGDSLDPEIKSESPALQEDSLPSEQLGVWVTQSCLTFHAPMDHSPPGSSAHGILEARILKWVTIAFSNHVVEKKCI